MRPPRHLVPARNTPGATQQIGSRPTPLPSHARGVSAIDARRMSSAGRQLGSAQHELRTGVSSLMALRTLAILAFGTLAACSSPGNSRTIPTARDKPTVRTSPSLDFHQRQEVHLVWLSDDLLELARGVRFNIHNGALFFRDYKPIEILTVGYAESGCNEGQAEPRQYHYRDNAPS